jgi:surface antigen
VRNARSLRLAAAAATVWLGVSTSCAQIQSTIADAPKTTIGGLGGAVAGGLLGGAIGGNTASVLAGAATGALLGGLAGNMLDQRDRRLAAEATQRALETGATGSELPWRNPDTGNSGTVTPVRTYQQASGRYCREYQSEIVVGGKTHQGFGTACRMPDGSWQIQS